MSRLWRYITDEEKTKMIRLKKQGITNKYIAQRFGCSLATVCKFTKGVCVDEIHKNVS